MEFKNYTAQDSKGRVLAGATANIYQTGTQIVVSVFDEDGNGVSQPLTADSFGQFSFAAANGSYDVAVTYGGSTSTIENERFFDPGDQASVAETLTNKTIDTANNTITVNLSDVSDWPASVSATEAGYLDGVTSGIQGQIDGKQDILSEGAFADGDKDKLDGIEASADVTDTDNVTAAGAVMGTKTTSATDGTAGRIPQFFSNAGIFGLGSDQPPGQDDFDATSKRSGFYRTTDSTTNIGSRPSVASEFGMSFVFSYNGKNLREIWGDVLNDRELWTRKYRDAGGGYGDWHSFLLMNASTGEGTHDLGVDQSVGTSDNFSYSIKTNATVRLTVSSAGDVGIGDHEADSKLDVDGAITQRPLSTDPADPADGHSVQWVSDGTGSGDAGDVMMKINVGGTVKTTTLVDYSTL